MIKRICIKDFNYREFGNWDEDMVYIGRRNISYLPKEISHHPSSSWGNDYVMTRYSERADAVNSFRIQLWHLIKSDPDAINRLISLQNKTLVCWCKENQLCHGDIIIKAVNYYVKNQVG